MKKPCPVCLGTGKVVDHAKLGRLMRRSREEAGVSQAALAKLMGVSASYLSCLEQGKRDWNLPLTDHLFHCLRTSTDKKELAYHLDMCKG